MAKMAAMSPAFPKKKMKGKKSVNPNIEGETPKGAMRGGGSTTKQKEARRSRLANLKL